MKKTIMVFLALCCIIGITGCGNETKQSTNEFSCYYVSNSKAVDISADGKQLIVELLKEITWKDDLTDCDFDFVFNTQNKKVYYHSSCGAFNDITNKCCAKLSDEQRLKVNEILAIENVVSFEASESIRYEVAVDWADFIKFGGIEYLGDWRKNEIIIS